MRESTDQKCKKQRMIFAHILLRAKKIINKKVILISICRSVFIKKSELTVVYVA